jgi:hypothetical protein
MPTSKITKRQRHADRMEIREQLLNEIIKRHSGQISAVWGGGVFFPDTVYVRATEFPNIGSARLVGLHLSAMRFKKTTRWVKICQLRPNYPVYKQCPVSGNCEMDCIGHTESGWWKCESGQRVGL